MRDGNKSLFPRARNERKADVGKLTTRYRADGAAAVVAVAETGCCRLREAGRGGDKAPGAQRGAATRGADRERNV